MTRGISTVVDAVVFLSLLSAAVLVVSVPPAEPTHLPADETATLLATGTATVTYEGPTEQRRATGSYAGLLARAALADAGPGDRTPPVAARFRRAVRGAVGGVVGPRTHVSARWRPYPDAPVAGAVGVGTEPPAGADVHAATVRVPVPLPAGGDGGRTVREEAEGIARAVVRGAVPGEWTALPRSRPVRESARDRLLRFGGTGATAAGSPPETRAAARTELADRLAADMRRRHRDPAAARENTDPWSVTVTVRRWER